jgi:hypothetical protein
MGKAVEHCGLVRQNAVCRRVPAAAKALAPLRCKAHVRGGICAAMMVPRSNAQPGHGCDRSDESFDLAKSDRNLVPKGTG